MSTDRVEREQPEETGVRDGKMNLNWPLATVNEEVQNQEGTQHAWDLLQNEENMCENEILATKIRTKKTETTSMKKEKYSIGAME
jgi:hypothetical protein